MPPKIWKYKNLAFLAVSLIFLWYFADKPFVLGMISRITSAGYLGVVATGVFFVSTFTVTPALVVLYRLAEHFNSYEIALLAGLGAVIGDLAIFRFLRDGVFEELKPIFAKLSFRVAGIPYLSRLAPLLGAIIIASPFPDEIGIGLMGISKIKTWQFMVLSFALNSLGIFIIISLIQNLN